MHHNDSSADPADPPRRRLDGWGFVGQRLEPSPEMLRWLEARLGTPEPFTVFAQDAWTPAPPAALPALGCAAGDDPKDRLAYARGRGFTDLVRLRSGTVPRLPDAVARPADEDELEALLAVGAGEGLRLVPWGGGTSVTGGVNALPGEAPVVTVDLGRLAGLERIDAVSRLATFGAGTLGPRLEAALAEHGFTLGHFPQSFELSTLGGWVVTRSAGQESLGNGRIENLVAGLSVVAPAGRLEVPALPASAAGPDLRQLFLGSEGRFGVVSRATVRIRPRPAATRVEAALLPDWASGMAAARRLIQEGCGLSLLRLSDGPETEMALAIGLAKSAFAPVVRGWLRLRGIGDGACLLLAGAGGEEIAVEDALEAARRIVRPHGAAWLGAAPGRRWLADRFRHPYLRDSLLDAGFATDTLETAAPWSRLDGIYAAVRGALAGAVAEGEREVPVLCHLSHPYRDGASLYFTFFFRCPRDPDAAIARWAALKRRATEALVDAGGTLSHHHGVGSWHAPWLARETGEVGHRVLSRVAAELDPRGVLNPHVLLAAEDRLEA